MKDAWSEENDHVELTNGFLSSSKSCRPNLLNGLTALPDRSTIISSLPTKDAADKLAAYFFDNYNPSLPARGKFATRVSLVRCLLLIRFGP
jgi:hypothetical protein